MEELLQLLLEEAERQHRSLWYSHGCEVEERSLRVLIDVFESVQNRLREQ